VTNALEGRVIAALSRIQNPRLENDLLSAGMVRDLAVSDDGAVSFTFLLGRQDPGTLVREARKAVAALEGVRADLIKISVVDPAGPAQTTHGPPQSVATGVPAPTPSEMPTLGKVIAVSSGKGGVGKSTVAVNLALALARTGSRVGVLDGDVYGPNVPMMLGLGGTRLETDGKQIMPAQAHGLQVVSIGFLTEDDAPIVWRGPMLHSAIRQFFQDVAWADLDYLIVDMPPGTGDVAMSLSQTVPVVGAVVVTTPQAVSLADTRRAVRMYQKLNIDTLGLVENMSYYTCGNCHHEADIFGHGGGEALAVAMDVPFLGRLPIYEPVRSGGDEGRPVVVAEPNSLASQAFMKMATRVAARISIAAHKAAEANKGKIPLIPVR
jgi:ATP-binding protein involved in chromosome partitioning